MYKQSFTAGVVLALFAVGQAGAQGAGYGAAPGGYQVPGYGGPAYGQPQPGGQPYGQGYQVPGYQGPAYGGASGLPQSSGYGVPGGGYLQPGPVPGYAPGQGGYGQAPGYDDQGGYGAPGVYGPAYGQGAPAGYGPQGYQGYGPVPYGEYPDERDDRRGRDEGGSGFNPMKMMPNPMNMFGGKKD
jgi:hypothetical protein